MRIIDWSSDVCSSDFWVRFSFSDNELAQLGGRISERNVKEVSLILPDGTLYQEKGKLNFAASQIDPELGTQQLRATFANKDHRLLPGQFVREIGRAYCRAREMLHV